MCHQGKKIKINKYRSVLILYKKKVGEGIIYYIVVRKNKG